MKGLRVCNVLMLEDKKGHDEHPNGSIVIEVKKYLKGDVYEMCESLFKCFNSMKVCKTISDEEKKKLEDKKIAAQKKLEAEGKKKLEEAANKKKKKGK